MHGFAGAAKKYQDCKKKNREAGHNVKLKANIEHGTRAGEYRTRNKEF